MPVHVSEVTGFSELRAWSHSTLFQIRTEDADYETNPLLIHLVGSRHGEGTN